MAKQIKPDDFVMKIITQDYDAVREAIANGFDVNTPIPGRRPIVESAVPAKDPLMLRILWDAGATPSTPWLEELFAEFDKGGDGSTLIEPKRDDDYELEDLTEGFTVKKLKPTGGTLRYSGAGISIEIHVEPFRLDKERVETSVRLDRIKLPDDLQAITNKSFKFPVNPTKGYIDGSIYLRHAHNPVDVTEIRFGKLLKKGRAIEARFKMAFDFGYEGSGFENENAVWNVELQIESARDSG
jgi:hypothetical protein